MKKVNLQLIYIFITLYFLSTNSSAYVRERNQSLANQSGSGFQIQKYDQAEDDFDVPWIIQNSETELPILAIADDTCDIYNIFIYDANNPASPLEQTDWSSKKVLDSENVPYFHLFLLNKNDFEELNLFDKPEIQTKRGSS